ncbi:uncharacterized protein PFL1_00307 [Pseudozyma flocculosa PF-1]|uniref:Glyoxalase/fosfomycin resistance/dioxygenase domain-containing protein n=1 Tax=Pseudozyma flocculosa TaxID=84751 RepID=A0A5C3ETU3_9BASI|nr:uncharacterized protein PFL1_00307 [Pseudozyma flocculosa PF-1]EPQ32110.1 hypothetical protein PFL1_00307 [Pseudozyma flocculosa PF-1]SPO34956.1 uncharacterized protein PSFLO_00427 [Pseudozyma flocculosa]
MTALLSSPHDFMSLHALSGRSRSPARSSSPHRRSSSARLSSPSRSNSSLATFVPASAASTANTTDDEMPDAGDQEADKPSRGRLRLTPEQKASFAAHIEESKKKFISDTAHLPKTTNMGLSNAEAAAAMSQNRFNYSKKDFSWDLDDDDGESSGVRRKVAVKDTAVFQMALPVLYVSSIPNSVLFFQKVLGFSTVGKPATHQAVVRRGPAAKLTSGTNARNWSAVPPLGQDPGVRIVLRMRPQEWGELSGDGMGPPQLMVAVSSADDLYKEVSAKMEALRPKGDEYFPEVWFFKAKVLSKPQNKPWGARELHLLDPDGNKIVFFNEIHR